MKQNRRTFIKVMMKTAALAFLFAAVAAPLAAIDYGANLNSRTAFDGPVDFADGNPVFRNTLSGFVRRNPVTRNETFGRVLLELSVTNTLSRTTDGDWASSTLVDLDTFRIDGFFPEWRNPEDLVRTSIGRFPIAEASGLVFSDRIDGASMSFDFPDYGLVFAGGFTGLIPGGATGVLMTADDVLDAGDASTIGASSRLLGFAQATVPEAFARQAVSAGVLAQTDLRQGFDTGDADEKLNSQYIFATLGGPLTGDLYYSTALALSFQQLSFADPLSPNGLSDPENSIGIGAQLQAQYYLDPAGGSVITAMARYGSAAGDTLGAFTPMTGPAVSLLNPISASDLSFFMLDYALRPFAGQSGARARSLEVSAYSAVTAGANPFADGSYEGVEAGSRVTYRPFSDLGARLWVGTFIPSETDDTRVYGRLELSASF